jgi:hypothetical protein
MGAGSEYDDGISTPRLPGRENDAAAGDGPAPSVPPPAAAPQPGMARALRSLRHDWDQVFVIAACDTGQDEVWTAVSHDGLNVITHGSWVTFAKLLREVHGRYPVPGPRHPVAGIELQQARAAHPGFAIIETAAGASAFRGGRSWSAGSAAVVGCMLADQEHQDARAVALGHRA